jgi:hypothetical protein
LKAHKGLQIITDQGTMNKYHHLKRKRSKDYSDEKKHFNHKAESEDDEHSWKPRR